MKAASPRLPLLSSITSSCQNEVSSCNVSASIQPFQASSSLTISTRRRPRCSQSSYNATTRPKERRGVQETYHKEVALGCFSAMWHTSSSLCRVPYCDISQSPRLLYQIRNGWPAGKNVTEYRNPASHCEGTRTLDGGQSCHSSQRSWSSLRLGWRDFAIQSVELLLVHDVSWILIQEDLAQQRIANFGFNSARCDSSRAYTNALCPAGGHMSLLQRLSNGYQWQGRSGSGTLIATLPFHPQLKAYTMISSQRNIMAIETTAVAVHGPAAFVSENLGDSWYDAAISATVTQGPLDPTARYGYYLSMKSTVETFVPAVRVVCSPSDILRRGHNEVTFPRIPDYGPAVELENKSDWGSGRIRESRPIAVQDEGL
jgi:hypothetical protein